MRSASIFVTGAVLLATTSTFAATITQWNFNSATAPTPNDNTNPALLSPAPSSGAGTASLVVATGVSYASGVAGGGSSDTSAATAPPQYGWNITAFTAPSTGNETAGVQFLASTAGYQNISVSWDQRHSNSASRHVAVYYTIDGTTWNRLTLDGSNSNPGATPAGGNPASTAGLYGTTGTFSGFGSTVTGAGDDWFNGRSVDFSSITGANNNANFGIRILSSFDGGTNYVGSGSTNYAATGTWRFDMVTFNGTVIPEPASLAGLLGATLALRRRRA